MSAPKPDVKLSRDELEQLCMAANAGDVQSRARLRLWLDAHPDAWRAVGDAGKRSEMAVRDALADGDFLLGEALARSADVLRKSLLPADATPLEQLAVQRLIVCWHQVQLAEQRIVAQNGAEGRSSYWTRSLDSAHKRFTGAVSHLQSLKKLLGRPSCQAAVADVLAGVSTTTGDQREAESPCNGQPTEQPTARTEQRTSNSEDCRTPSRNGKPDHDASDLSGVLPFRVG